VDSSTPAGAPEARPYEEWDEAESRVRRWPAGPGRCRCGL